MVLLENMLFRRLRRRNRILVCLGDLEEFRVLEHLPPDQRHISGTGIMIRVGKSACIGKIGIHTAKLPASDVHLLHEPIVVEARIPAHIVRDCIRRLIR